jgi:anti-sigma factor RsiW
MRTEHCRDWRISLGAYVLGHLDAEEKAGLEAHLEGCADCQAELETLGGVAKLLPNADPVRFESAPEPSAELGRRIFEKVNAERKAEKKRRRRRRQFGFGFGGVAVAAAAAALALVILPGGSGGGTSPEQSVEFTSLPPGVEIGAKLEPHAFGTAIHVYVSGVRSGTLCKVFLKGEDGTKYPAGSFRYRWGEDSEAVLSSGLDLSSTAQIGVVAGKTTFTAPVNPTATALIGHQQEDAT